VDLGHPVSLDEADEALRASFLEIFGAVEPAEPLV
jgi:lipoyl(octanoyl) transferase